LSRAGTAAGGVAGIAAIAVAAVAPLVAVVGAAVPVAAAAGADDNDVDVAAAAAADGIGVRGRDVGVACKISDRTAPTGAGVLYLTSWREMAWVFEWLQGGCGEGTVPAEHDSDTRARLAILCIRGHDASGTDAVGALLARGFSVTTRLVVAGKLRAVLGKPRI
jgi:hypothetical protein